MRKRLLLAGSLVAFTISMPAFAAMHHHSLNIVSKVLQFKSFYTEASTKKLDEKQRWALWQKKYGIAAVPPTPAGKALARKNLNKAWDKYQALYPKLDSLEQKAKNLAATLFAKDNMILKTADHDIKVTIVLYVGQFDNNAYTLPSGKDRDIMVIMPIENTHLDVALAHEITHAIHMQLADDNSGYGGTLGETVMKEGIAEHVSQLAVPGLDTADYVAKPGQKDWLKKCEANKQRIISGIEHDLHNKGKDLAEKYIYGKGNTGLHRELYCAGWNIVGTLMKQHSLAELARVPQKQMVNYIEQHYYHKASAKN